MKIQVKFSGIGAQRVDLADGTETEMQQLSPGSAVRIAPNITAEIKKVSGEKGDLLPCYVEAIATIHAERQGE